jgi:hypothetical protein
MPVYNPLDPSSLTGGLVYNPTTGQFVRRPQRDVSALYQQSNIGGRMTGRTTGKKGMRSEARQALAGNGQDTGETPTTPVEYGAGGSSPGIQNISTDLMGDYGRAQTLAEQNFARRQGGLEGYSGQVQDIRDALKQAAASGEIKSVADIDSFLQKIMGTTGAAGGKIDKLLAGAGQRVRQTATQATGTLQNAAANVTATAERGGTAIEQAGQQAVATGMEALSGSKQKLDEMVGEFNRTLSTERDANSKTVQDTWGRVADALNAHHEQMTAKMGDWNTGHMAQLRAGKQQMAAQLAAQGYRPEEIQAELRKMDIQGAQQQAGQMAQFQVEEQQMSDTLRQQYTTLGTQVEMNARNVGASLAGVEGAFKGVAAGTYKDIATGQALVAQWGGEMVGKAAALRMQGAQTAGALTEAAAQGWQRSGEVEAGLSQARAEAMKFLTGINTQARTSALWGKLQARSQKVQYSAMADQLALQGDTVTAQLFQDLEQTFEPLAPYTMALFGINTDILTNWMGGQANLATMGSEAWNQLGDAGGQLFSGFMGG